MVWGHTLLSLISIKITIDHIYERSKPIIISLQPPLNIGILMIIITGSQKEIEQQSPDAVPVA